SEPQLDDSVTFVAYDVLRVVVGADPRIVRMRRDLPPHPLPNRTTSFLPDVADDRSDGSAAQWDDHCRLILLDEFLEVGAAVLDLCFGRAVFSICLTDDCISLDAVVF